MKLLQKSIALLTAFFAVSIGSQAQVCIPTYATVCFTGGGAITEDLIDNFWTVGGTIDITNLDTDCCMLPDNYWYTGLEVHGCPGETIETNVQCEVDAFDQGFAIWIDWNQDDVFAAAEKVYASPGFGDEVWTGSFTIPVDAAPGDYNMRVRASYAEGGATINPCDMQTYGETEDYIVVVGTCDPTICEGDTVELDLGTMPPGVISYDWSPATYISDPGAGPLVDVWPPDTTTYTCTITSVDSVWMVDIEVYVVHPANPDAGLDDTICHDIVVPYPLDGTVDVDEATLDILWELDAFVGAGSPATIFTPGDDALDTDLQVSIPGLYKMVLYTEDLGGVCPPQSDTVEITFAEALHELESTDPLCFGSADGTITVTGTGTLPTIEYSIDGGDTWQVSNVFTDLPSGVYTVTSRDEGGCEFSSDIELVDPEEVVIMVSSDTLICQNGTATVSASATGGAVFTYDWSIPGDDGDTQTLSPDVNTTVTVTATNEFGCTSEIGVIEVTLRDPITLNITENDSICPGYESGATVVALGGDGAYTYTWTENGDAMADLGNSITTNPDLNTVYCVTVEDGCETSPETICTQTIMRPVPEPSFTSDITAACNPETVNFETMIDPTDVAVWTMDGVTYTDMPTVSHDFSEVGFFDVTLLITNQYGCFNEITATDYIEMVDIPYPDFYINPNPTTMFNTTIRLTPAVEGSGNTYFWDTPGGDPATSTEESPQITYPEGVPADYPVELTVTNAFGCFNTVSHVVNVVTDVIIYVPNTFTPDGDAFNEGWSVTMDGIDIYDYHCTVFNRWGEIVWESYDLNGVWYGDYGSELAPSGTYVWVIQTKESTTDKKLEFRGTVLLNR